jgi:hypothetical protein
MQGSRGVRAGQEDGMMADNAVIKCAVCGLAVLVYEDDDHHLVVYYGCDHRIGAEELVAESTAKDATIAALRAQLEQAQRERDALLTAAKEEDAAAGQAIRGYFAKIEGRYLTSAKMEITVHRYDLEGRPEAHWNIHARIESKERDVDDICTDGRDQPDNPTLSDAFQSAGLLEAK